MKKYYYLHVADCGVPVRPKLQFIVESETKWSDTEYNDGKVVARNSESPWKLGYDKGKWTAIKSRDNKPNPNWLEVSKEYTKYLDETSYKYALILTLSNGSTVTFTGLQVITLGEVKGYSIGSEFTTPDGKVLTICQQELKEI